ncbi:uroporphyrinogen-III synthase [Bacillus dakarensis]|uniref:uroporphyrinogen-III synthase n=1 Tax=Robertmurraya dakarensis TaxID=1926278 RepID=UPI000981FDC5|nr:uroporphyrinogen-III synthase [Bacillus dakarensis]
MKKLEGKVIALLGSRKIDEMSKLVENQGGVPLSRPAQGTAILDDSKLKEDLYLLVEGKFEWVIFTTGIGIETLLNAAEKNNMKEEFLRSLKGMKIAARGYKTVNMLKKLELIPLVRDDDGSTAGLVRELSAHSLEKSRVALQLHGDPAPRLREWLEEQHAEYKEILPYIHIAPEKDVLEKLLSEILNGDVDAVVFTSTPQVRNLVNFSAERNLERELKEKFEDEVVALSVGKVTAQALREEGINKVVFPQLERMGSAIVELANYYHQKA